MDGSISLNVALTPCLGERLSHPPRSACPAKEEAAAEEEEEEEEQEEEEQEEESAAKTRAQKAAKPPSGKVTVAAKPKAVSKRAKWPGQADADKRRQLEIARTPAERSDKTKAAGRFPRPMEWEAGHRSYDFSRHESYRYLVETPFAGLPNFAKLLVLDSGLTEEQWNANELNFSNFDGAKGFFRSKVEIDFTDLADYSRPGNQPEEWKVAPTCLAYYHVWSVLFGFTEATWQQGKGLIGWAEEYEPMPAQEDLAPLGTWQSDFVEGGTFHRVFVAFVDEWVLGKKKKLKSSVVTILGTKLALKLEINEGDDPEPLHCTEEFLEWLDEVQAERVEIMDLSTGLELSQRTMADASPEEFVQIAKPNAGFVSSRHDNPDLCAADGKNLRQVSRPDYRDKKKAREEKEFDEKEFTWLMFSGGHFAGKTQAGACTPLPDEFVDENFSNFLVDVRGLCLQTLCKLNQDKWLRIPVGAAREGSDSLPDLPLWMQGPCVPKASTCHNDHR